MIVLIKNKLDQIKNNITLLEKKYKRIPGAIQLLAVSKTKPIELIQQAYDAGQRAFGENYVQEAIDKINKINKINKSNFLLSSSPIEWHYIGKLQSNKAKLVAENFDWVQTVDSLKLAERLNHFRASNLTSNLSKLNICIQVNVTNEPQKSGIKLNELDALAEAIDKLPRLKLRGLMAIGVANDPEQNKKSYENLTKIFKNLKSTYLSIDTLSLGMSQDIELAVEHGSTMVRIGRAIFGERER